MRYALLITAPMSAAEELARDGEGYERFHDALGGKIEGGAALVDRGSATTVRVREDEVLTIDGPFLEGKEQITGFYLVEAADLDEAIRWASQIPAAAYGAVEVRPILDFGE